MAYSYWGRGEKGLTALGRKGSYFSGEGRKGTDGTRGRSEGVGGTEENVMKVHNE